MDLRRRLRRSIALSVILVAASASAGRAPSHQMTAHHLALLDAMRDLMAEADHRSQLAKDNPGADGDRLSSIVDALSTAVIAADRANEVAGAFDDTTDSVGKGRQGRLLGAPLTHTRSYVVRAELRAKSAVNQLTSPPLGAAGRKGFEALIGVDGALQDFANTAR